jgi:hypothetical protein
MQGRTSARRDGCIYTKEAKGAKDRSDGWRFAILASLVLNLVLKGSGISHGKGMRGGEWRRGTCGKRGEWNQPRKKIIGGVGHEKHEKHKKKSGWVNH